MSTRALGILAVAALAIAWNPITVGIIGRYLPTTVRVEGDGMHPTHEDGAFLLVDRQAAPARGDVIVFRDPRDVESLLIRRVIGLPHEEVDIWSGAVYIDDTPIVEPYLDAPTSGTLGRARVPQGEYFVLGDNRENSLDSRSATIGTIREELVVGKVWLTYWPLQSGPVGFVLVVGSLTSAVMLTAASVVGAAIVSRRRGRTWAWGLVALMIGGLAAVILAIAPRRS